MPDYEHYVIKSDIAKVYILTMKLFGIKFDTNSNATNAANEQQRSETVPTRPEADVQIREMGPMILMLINIVGQKQSIRKLSGNVQSVVTHETGIQNNSKFKRQTC